jgi:hypothetical protein
MSSKNAEIKDAIDAFDLPRARQLLREAMPEANAETFYLASRAALDDDQRVEFLEQALALDPFHEAARHALRRIKSGEATPASPASAPSSPARANTAADYVKQLGVHHFIADIPLEADANLKLVDDFFIGLGYKRTGELTYKQRIQFIGGSFRVDVRALSGRVSVTAKCSVPMRTKRLANIAALDAVLRDQLHDLAATLISGSLTTEKAVQAQVGLDQSIQEASNQWYKEQNSPAVIIFLVIMFILMVWFFGWGLPSLFAAAF